MDLAIMAYSYSGALRTGAMDMPAVVRRARELGASGLELTESLLRPEAVPAVQKALAETGLTVVCYDLVCDVATPIRGERQARVADFHSRLRRAAAFGARRAMVIPGLTDTGVDPVLSRRWFCEALRESLAEAARLGVTLTVENLGTRADLYGRSEQIRAICEEVGPGLRVTFDAGNFLLAGEDSVAALGQLAPRLSHVHFKDWKVVPEGTAHAYPGVDGRLYQGVALGDGLVDLRGVMGRLQELGYRGAVSVEYEGPGDSDEAVRRGLAHLRSLALDRDRSGR
jgi:sugar phosphate isomerase/epimerase